MSSETAIVSSGIFASRTFKTVFPGRNGHESRAHPMTGARSHDDRAQATRRSADQKRVTEGILVPVLVALFDQRAHRGFHQKILVAFFAKTRRKRNIDVDQLASARGARRKKMTELREAERNRQRRLNGSSVDHARIAAHARGNIERDDFGGVALIDHLDDVVENPFELPFQARAENSVDDRVRAARGLEELREIRRRFEIRELGFHLLENVEILQRGAAIARIRLQIKHADFALQTDQPPRDGERVARVIAFSGENEDFRFLPASGYVSRMICVGGAPGVFHQDRGVEAVFLVGESRRGRAFQSWCRFSFS